MPMGAPQAHAKLFRNPVNLRFVRNPPRIDGKRGDHFQQADFSLPTQPTVHLEICELNFGAPKKAHRAVLTCQASFLGRVLAASPKVLPLALPETIDLEDWRAPSR